jgi:hypothetical protein
MTGPLIGGKIHLDGIRAPAQLWKGQLIQKHIGFDLLWVRFAKLFGFQGSHALKDGRRRLKAARPPERTVRPGLAPILFFSLRWL